MADTKIIEALKEYPISVQIGCADIHNDWQIQDNYGDYYFGRTFEEALSEYKKDKQ